MQHDVMVLLNTAEFACIVQMIDEGDAVLESPCLAIQVDIRACWQIQEKEKLEKLLLFWPYLHLGLAWRHSQINLKVFYR